MMQPVQVGLPHVNSAVIRSIRVLNNDNRIIEKDILISLSGKYYSIERYIRETIYGVIRTGVIMEVAECGNMLIYSNPIYKVAIKIFYRKNLIRQFEKNQENPFNEIATMQMIHERGGHENYIQYIECCSDKECLYLIMEYCNGGELFNIIEINNKLHEDIAKRYFKQIVLGLQYLHSLGIGHRDMSLENIMVTNTGICKIIDLGMCIRKSSQESNGQLVYYPMQPQGRCGKQIYISPETYLQYEPYDPCQADIWALGVILFIMITGFPPCKEALMIDSRYCRIANGSLIQMIEEWGIRLDPSLANLLSRLLHPNPKLRICIEDILIHPWLTATVILHHDNIQIQESNLLI